VRWDELRIEHRLIDAQSLAELEPAVNQRAECYFEGALVPPDAQIRNPRHVRALLAACRQTGVTVIGHSSVRRLRICDESIVSARTDKHTYCGEQLCIASGCWSAEMTRSLGIELAVRPVRGQIALLAGMPGLLKRNINVGSRYLVPRDDGRILVGSTEEEAGFDARTTADGVDGLLEFATNLARPLEELPIERSWAGLRPATEDGLPYIGQFADQQRIWMATGHFRAGLQLSSGTAEVLAQLMTGEQPSVSIDDLSPNRSFEAAQT
jgi:glycine oxidase